MKEYEQLKSINLIEKELNVTEEKVKLMDGRFKLQEQVLELLRDGLDIKILKAKQKNEIQNEEDGKVK